MADPATPPVLNVGLDLGERLSGEGNLALLLTSIAMDQMARQGDPMAGYLRYLSGANGQQM
jgi:hypothetical protein